jgi:hypothetical protein
MIEITAGSPDDSVIDVGGGASVLVDALLARGFGDVTVLGVSTAGLDIARRRLGSAADQVHWLRTDILTRQPRRTYRVWHDRAALHFLTTGPAQRQYLHALHAATVTTRGCHLRLLCTRRAAAVLRAARCPLRACGTCRGTGQRMDAARRRPRTAHHPYRRHPTAHLGSVSPTTRRQLPRPTGLIGGLRRCMTSRASHPPRHRAPSRAATSIGEEVAGNHELSATSTRIHGTDDLGRCTDAVAGEGSAQGEGDCGEGL